MKDETPIGPIVEGAKKASIHFAKAAYETMVGIGSLVGGVTAVVRRPGADDVEGDDGPQHVPVE